MGCYCPKYYPYSKQGSDDQPVVNMLGKVYEAGRKADPCSKWETYPGRCTSRPGGNEYELGHWYNADLPYEDVARICAEACAKEKSGHCTGFDVMLQYGYEGFSQCRIYGKKSNLVNAKEGYRWNQDERNDGWPRDVINDGDGTSDTFCAGKVKPSHYKP